jgi:hypothetical protein
VSSALVFFPPSVTQEDALLRQDVHSHQLPPLPRQRAIANHFGALERDYGIVRRPSYLARPPQLNGPSARVRQVSLTIQKNLEHECLPLTDL